jgi:hypothetical protein
MFHDLYNKAQDYHQLPDVASLIEPLKLNADAITAGQNGVTFFDQSAYLISC